MAKLGVGILIIPQKPWKRSGAELEAYREVYRQVNGVDAPPPISAGWTFCDRSASAPREMARRYIGGYYQTVLDHYQFQGDHLAKTKGYEYYGKMAEKIHQYGTDTVIDYFMNLQVWGTPEQCYEKILRHPRAHRQQPLRRACSATRGCRTTRRSATCASSPRK